MKIENNDIEHRHNLTKIQHEVSLNKSVKVQSMLNFLITG